MSAPHEKRICKRLTPKQLDTIVSDYHMFSIASDIEDWKLLAPSLFLTESDQIEISEDFEDNYYLQKKEALSRWRLNSSPERPPTYRTLIKIFCFEKQIDVAERIAEYCGSKEPHRNIQIFNKLNWYLLECYRCLPHPFCLQLPSRLSRSKSIKCKYFDLVLHKAHINEPQRQSRSVDSSLQVTNLYTALIKNKQEKRLIVYFEGIAGSGKTTLSWHISREWTEKRLLIHYELFIYVQVNDPKVQSASCLKDLIPNPYDDEVLQKEIAKVIVGLKGRNVCFLLDGLDEAPTSLLDFLLIELIQGKLGRPQLPDLSFILMSRPDSRVTKRLESVLSSRIVVAGFNKEAMDQFFDSSLGTKSDERQKLMECFSINPRLEGLCSLPINAVIMSYLVHFIEEDSTPTTQTGLYKPLISNFLLRHIDTYLPELNVSCIEDLHSDIPPEILDPFSKICSLAYSSLVKNKHLFTMKEIRAVHTADAKDVLGFLQVHPQLTRFGRKRYYSFAHLSLQEFLAAVHVSKMSENDQNCAIKEFLSKSPRSQMIPFYAGLTGLSNNKVLQILLEALHLTVDSVTVTRELLEERGDPQQSALALFNSLFESQNKTLLTISETDLPINRRIEEGIQDLHKDSNFTPRTHQLRSLMLHSLPLTPLDCLSLGYYINIKSCIPTLESYTLAFDLVCCSLNHTGIHMLFTELKRNISQRTKARVQLIMTGNKFNNESLLSLKDLVQGQSNVDSIALCNCFKPSLVNINFALKCLIEGLSNNSSCIFIDLSANSFDSSHIYYIVLLLSSCPQINWLELKDYDLSGVMPLFSRAVALTTSLRSLILCFCNISDSHLVLLGKEISTNHCPLHHLNVSFNPFTHRGLGNFLKLFMGTISNLAFLGLSLQLSDSENMTVKKINQFRASMSIRLPCLCTKTIKDTHNFSSSLISMLQLEQLRKIKDRH